MTSQVNILLYVHSNEVAYLGRGQEGNGGEGGGRMKARPRAPTRKIEEDVDRRQNNKNVKAMSPRYWVSS